MGTFLQDLRYAIRLLAKSPGFTIVAILTLGLGIGANTVMFSIVNSVLLRPLAYAGSERLVRVYSSNSVRNSEDAYFQDFLDWRVRNHTFDAIAATWQNDANLIDRNGPEKVRDAFATADLFTMLGVHPVLGRLFRSTDDRIGYEPIALLSYNYWQSHLGGDPSVIGRPIAVDGAPYRVVGVLPRGFHYPGATDVWLPMGAGERYLIGFHDDRRIRAMETLGRLRPGVTVEAAAADMNVIMAQLAAEHPLTNTGWHVRLSLLQDETVGQSRRSLLILMGAAGLVLLIACANIAGLLLARGAGRAREFAVRGALGGSRSRLVQQILTESVLLGVVGGIAGALLAYVSYSAILAMIPRDLPRLDEIRLDIRAFLFTFALSILSAVVFSLMPALSTIKIDLQTMLRSGARQSSNTNLPMRKLLIAGEMACAMILLLGAGLLLQSFLRLTKVRPGYNPHNLITGSIGFPDADMELKAQTSIAKQVIANLKSLPGVIDAAGTSRLPLVNFKREAIPVQLEGEAQDTSHAHLASTAIVTPGFFGAMQIPLLSGRAFSDVDVSRNIRPVVINEMAARDFWPGQNPLGKRLQFDWTTRENREVIGVVGDVKQGSLALASEPEVYMPFDEVGYSYVSFVVRTEQTPAAFGKTLVDQIHKVDSTIAVYDLETLDQLASESIDPNRFYMRLVGAFGLAALALAAIGIYGLISFTVEQRTKEMGVRLALGALPRELLFMVVGQGLRLAGLGLVVGILGALAMGRVFSALLFGVHFDDPATFIAVALVLMGVALLACYIPARRAMRVDPMVALRYE